MITTVYDVNCEEMAAAIKMEVRYDNRDQWIRREPVRIFS
jgi:hypothetical protein